MGRGIEVESHKMGANLGKSANHNAADLITLHVRHQS